MTEVNTEKDKPEENNEQGKEETPVYSPPKLEKFEKLQKLIVSGE